MVYSYHGCRRGVVSAPPVRGSEIMANESSIDRAVRLTLGVLFLGLSFIFLAGAWKIIFGAFGVIAIVTATIGICPVYTFFKISTK